MLHPATGNLLAAEVDALVNPVNCVGVMGKGLALQFKTAYPEVFRAYRAAAQRGEVVPGRMHVHPTGRSQPRFIVNFPTKRHWREPSRLDDIEAGLADLVERISALAIRSIALPALGAGLGGLDWAEVRALIEQAVAPLAEVDVLLYAPREATRPPP